MTPLCPKKDLRFKLKDLKYGFTFIELLVVISISIILFTIGIASYNNFNETRTVEKAAEELKTNIRLVQSKAINNEKPAACGTNPLLGWFLARVDSFSYRMSYQCETMGIVNVTTFTMPTGVTINSFNTIQFKPLGGTYLTNNEVIIVQGFSGKQNSVTVAKSGDVESD